MHELALKELKDRTGFDPNEPVDISDGKSFEPAKGENQVTEKEERLLMKTELKEKLRLKCAEVDGYEDTYTHENGGLVASVSDGMGGEGVYFDVPAYDNETDILRVVRLLKDDTLEKYITALALVVVGDSYRGARASEDFIAKLIAKSVATATADQMLEALAEVWGME